MRLCRRYRAGIPFRQFDLASVALMIDLVRAAAGPEWRPSRVELQSSGPVGLGDWEMFSQASVAVDQPVTSITFPRALLGRALAPLPAAASPVGALDPRRQTPPPSDFVTSLEVVIDTLLACEHADLGSAARAAGLSMRSLQRRLRKLDVSYSDLLDRVRLHSARALLRDKDVKIVEIALELGYSDPAHFTRAFRRWTSCTPMAYRQLHLAGGEPARRSA